MVFLVWSLFWVYYSSNYWMLCIPIIAILTRAGYLARKVFPVLQYFAFIGAIVLFLSQLAFGSDCYSAGLYSMKILVSGLILNHLFLGFEDIVPSRFGPYFGTLFVLVDRCRVLSFDRIKDVVESYRVRRKDPNYTRRSLLLGAIGTAFREIESLGTDIDRIRRSRGNIPVTAGWAVPGTKRNLIPLADSCLLCLVVLVVLLEADKALPDHAIDLINRIRGFLFVSK